MSTKPEIIVRFEGVEKTYDGRTNVVDCLDLDIYKGEFLTLLGPSGSGKTTILLMLAGFEATTAGDITLHNQSLRNVPPFKRDMGIVFQNYALFPHKSVFQNIAFPLVQRRLPKAEISERAAAALRMVELGDLGDRRPNQLSGGQQQRVALARALVFEPQLVLMDEPLGALDKQLREQMQIEIKHLHEALGMTVVYVTHDQGEALTMSDRVAILNDGLIQQIDTPHEVYENPANSFVANFIGENNNLQGRIESVEGPTCTVRLMTGETVTARVGAVGAAGDRTTLSVRPERLEINPATASFTNRFKGTVLEVIYFGDHNTVRLAMAGQEDFIAHIPASAPSSTLRSGEEVEICWSPDHCCALEPL